MYPQLDYLPRILRPLRLGLFAFLLFIYLVALIFSAAWSLTHNGLWDYAGFGDSRYFVFQYLPTLLGMILLVWLFEIELAVFRIAPLIAWRPNLRKVEAAGRFCHSIHPDLLCQHLLTLALDSQS